MATTSPRAKRRRLSHTLEEPGSSGVEANGIEDDSALRDVSDYTEKPNGRSEAKLPRLVSRQAKSNGFRRHKASTGGQTSASDQLMAFTSSGGSSMITLQVNDLLEDISLDHEKVSAAVQQTLHEVQNAIRSIPDTEPMTVLEAEQSLRREAGVHVPFPNPRPGKDIRYTFEYKQPTQLTLVGNIQLQTAVASKDPCTIDLAVRLPDCIFQEKDFLNYRYFHKRAFYVARIAAGIKNKFKDVFKFSFEHQDGIDLKPVLILEPTGHSHSLLAPSKAQFHIRIICSINPDLFQPKNTMPTKCSLRSSEERLPTPYYNACLRSEATVELYHRLLQRTMSQCEALGDACRLGSVWLRRRGFAESACRGGFGSFEWSIVCALLLQSGGTKGRPALSPRYTYLQLFKAVLQFLAARDLTEPLVLADSVCKIQASSSPVLFDGTGQINVLFKMTPWTYRMLQMEARATIEAFSSEASSPFDLVFIKQLDFNSHRFDQYVVLDHGVLFHNKQNQVETREVLQKLYDILSKALGNRVRSIHLQHDINASRSLDTPSQSGATGEIQIGIGLLLDPDHYTRLVDHGPAAEDQAAARHFRTFWGEKAELRRFKDGSINESLIWSEKSSVIQQIVTYILQLHFDLPSNLLHFVGDQLEHVVVPRNSLLPRKSAFKHVNDSFQSLISKLRGLEGLPLTIRSILPTSPQLRSASLQCPVSSSPILPVEVLIEFEGSARWPDSLPAIQRSKIAFLVKLCDLLCASDSAVTCRVGLENTTTSYGNPCYLDIILPSSTAGLLPSVPFRVRIHHDRTLTLLQKALSTATTLDRPTLIGELQSFTRDNLAAPRHTTAVTTLCTRFPSLPTTILLLKSWTASHHLLNQIPEPILEILAAVRYLDPYPYPSPPASGQTAFFRTLDLVAEWDWVADPLLLDLSGHSNVDSSTTTNGLTAESFEKLRTRFTAWRKTLDPGLNNVVWFVGTNIDETGVVWTQGGRPSRVVAARFTALARASMDLVKGHQKERSEEERKGKRPKQQQQPKGEKNKRQKTRPTVETIPLDWKLLFKSPLTDFDFVIHLRKRSQNVNRSGPTSTTHFQNLVNDQRRRRQQQSSDPFISFDPTSLYLQDLERTFNHHQQQNIVFFHGTNSGSRIIAGLWNPKILAQPSSTAGSGNTKRRDWRVNLGYSSVPVMFKENENHNDNDEEEEEEKKKRQEMKKRENNDATSNASENEAESVDIIQGLPNQRAMLVEMEMLGRGLVERIEVFSPLD